MTSGGALALGVGAAALGGIAAGYGTYKVASMFKKDGTQKKKYRTMNYNNPKALNRASRRLNSFVKHYKKHVSALGYTVHRKHT